LDASNCPAANGCGVHIHSGAGCDSSTDQGGHFFENITVDPWTDHKYSSTGQGTASFAGTIKIGSQDVANRAFVVHNAAGQRIGCGILEKAHAEKAMVEISNEEVVLDDVAEAEKEEATEESSKEVPTTEELTEELTETLTKAPNMKVEVMKSSADTILMIIVGMNEEMDDGTIAIWQNITAEYIKYSFNKQGNILTSLDVTLLVQEQTFLSWGRRNLRSLQTDTGKVVISYKQNNFYTTNGNTEVDAEMLAKEPFATSDLRTEYMNRLRATSAPAFLPVTDIEVVVIVEEVDIVEEVAEDNMYMTDIEKLMEDEKVDIADMKEVEEIPEEEKEDMKEVETISEEEKEEVLDVEEPAKEKEVEEESDSGLKILVIVFIAVLLLFAFVVFCKSDKKKPYCY